MPTVQPPPHLCVSNTGRSAAQTILLWFRQHHAAAASPTLRFWTHNPTAAKAEKTRMRELSIYLFSELRKEDLSMWPVPYAFSIDRYSGNNDNATLKAQLLPNTRRVRMIRSRTFFIDSKSLALIAFSWARLMAFVRSLPKVGRERLVTPFSAAPFGCHTSSCLVGCLRSGCYTCFGGYVAIVP